MEKEGKGEIDRDNRGRQDSGEEADEDKKSRKDVSTQREMMDMDDEARAHGVNQAGVKSKSRDRSEAEAQADGHADRVETGSDGDSQSNSGSTSNSDTDSKADSDDLEWGADPSTWEPKPPKVLMENPDTTPLELLSQIQIYATNELRILSDHSPLSAY